MHADIKTRCGFSSIEILRLNRREVRSFSDNPILFFVVCRFRPLLSSGLRRLGGNQQNRRSVPRKGANFTSCVICDGQSVL
jgi:hypothetical protein